MPTKMSRVEEHFEFEPAVLRSIYVFLILSGLVVIAPTILLGLSFLLPGNPFEIPGKILVAGVLLSSVFFMLAYRIRKKIRK